MPEAEQAGKQRVEELLAASEQYLAVMRGGGMGSSYHVVDTTTFDNSAEALEDDDGHTASVGGAEALCGHSPFGRMLPISGIRGSRICGNCIRSLEAELDGDVDD